MFQPPYIAAKTNEEHRRDLIARQARTGWPMPPEKADLSLRNGLVFVRRDGSGSACVL